MGQKMMFEGCFPESKEEKRETGNIEKIAGVEFMVHRFRSGEGMTGRGIKYEDVEAFIKNQKPELECNCEKNAFQPSGVSHGSYIDMTAWICPRHGYKTLLH
jgi:hypothetical protein